MEAARYRLTADDYAAYNRRICVRRWRWPLAFAITVIALGATTDYSTSGNPYGLYCLVIGAALLVLCFVVLIPRHARAIFSEHPSSSNAKTLTVDDRSVEFRQPSGSFRTEWRSIVQWDETPRLLVLYVNRAKFIAIPKEDIGEKLTGKIRECLVRSGLSRPLRRRPAN